MREHELSSEHETSARKLCNELSLEPLLDNARLTVFPALAFLRKHLQRNDEVLLDEDLIGLATTVITLPLPSVEAPR